MKHKTYMSLVVSTAFVLVLLLSTTHSSFAAKPAKAERTAAVAVVIYSVVVDYLNSKILVTGSGLDGISTATLAGVDVFGDVSSIDASNTELNFSSGMETAVPGEGNYSLVLNDTVLSVYMASAIIAPLPGPATCPCEAFWFSYGGANPPGGFATLEPLCVYESSSGDQASVQFYNVDYSQIWILTSEYNNNAHECALVIDEPTQTLNNPQQHTACVNYLKTTYIDTYAATKPSCL